MDWITQSLIQAGLLLWLQANALSTPPSHPIMAEFALTAAGSARARLAGLSTMWAQWT